MPAIQLVGEDERPADGVVNEDDFAIAAVADDWLGATPRVRQYPIARLIDILPPKQMSMSLPNALGRLWKSVST